MEEDFEERPRRQSDELTLAIDGWEGPLDLLLSLARVQKVDLAQISILQLVEQYLTYLAEARALKLEIAADYLVMAAWLAYLKSCLLLPKDPEADPSPEEIALRLQMRLQRLDAMREAGARLLVVIDRTRRFSTRCAGRTAADPQSHLAGPRFRSVHGLWGGSGADRAGDARGSRAFGHDSRRGDRSRWADDRHGHRLDDAREFPPSNAGPAIPAFVSCLQFSCDA